MGVVPVDDAKYLAIDYGVHVASTLDLRHIADELGVKPEGLAKMAKEHLNVVMEKDWRISCSDWEQPELTPVQVSYAATDAHVGVALYKQFVGFSRWRSMAHNRKVIADYERYLDLRFHYSRNKRYICKTKY